MYLFTGLVFTFSATNQNICDEILKQCNSQWINIFLFLVTDKQMGFQITAIYITLNKWDVLYCFNILSNFFFLQVNSVFPVYHVINGAGQLELYIDLTLLSVQTEAS